MWTAFIPSPLPGCRPGRPASLLALILCVVASISRAQGPGDLDPTFTASANGGYGSVYALAVQPDGKIILGGEFTAVNGTPRRGLARLNPDGSLDAGFDAGNDGQGCRALALVPDGRLLVQNYIPYRMGVVRLSANGHRDLTFSAGVDDDDPMRVAPLSGDKVLLGGYFREVNGVPHPYLARLNADGSLDNTFAVNVNGLVYDLTPQADGKVLIAGGFTQVNGVVSPSLIRVLADGRLDTTFRAEIVGSVSALTVQADRKILLRSTEKDPARTMNPSYLVRLNADGSPDATFQAESDARPQALAVQPDGKILLISGSAVTRLHADGTRDFAFNVRLNGDARAVAAQADGKVLLGGGFTLVNGTSRAGVSRLQGGSRSAFFVTGAPERGGFVVRRTDALDEPLAVSYHHGGSAVDGADYGSLPGVVAFPAGQSEVVIPVNLLPGANRNRKVKVFLDPSPSGAYAIGKAQSKVFLSDLP